MPTGWPDEYSLGDAIYVIKQHTEEQVERFEAETERAVALTARILAFHGNRTGGKRGGGSFQESDFTQ